MEDLAAARSLIGKLAEAFAMLHGRAEVTIEQLDRMTTLVGEHMGDDAEALLASLRSLAGQLGADRDFYAANRELIRGYGFGEDGEAAG